MQHMSDDWTEIGVDDLRAGDRVRARGTEFDIARIDAPFLGRDEMVCLIEDTPTRWHAYPMGRQEKVQVLRAG
jgi:hypothetical protein